MRRAAPPRITTFTRLGEHQALLQPLIRAALRAGVFPGKGTADLARSTKTLPTLVSAMWASLTTLSHLFLPTICSRTLMGLLHPLPFYTHRRPLGCGSLLLSASVDVRSSGDVIAFCRLPPPAHAGRCYLESRRAVRSVLDSSGKPRRRLFVQVRTLSLSRPVIPSSRHPAIQPSSLPLFYRENGVSRSLSLSRARSLSLCIVSVILTLMSLF